MSHRLSAILFAGVLSLAATIAYSTVTPDHLTFSDAVGGRVLPCGQYCISCYSYSCSNWNSICSGLIKGCGSLQGTGPDCSWSPYVHPCVGQSPCTLYFGCVAC
jgi:hypothetical protein